MQHKIKRIIKLADARKGISYMTGEAYNPNDPHDISEWAVALGMFGLRLGQQIDITVL